MATSAIVPHIRIDNSIIDQYLPLIGPYGYTIYSVIKRYFNQKTGDCYPSYKTIARKSGIDRSTVIRYVKKLRDFKLISPEWRFKEDGSHTSNQYHFHGRENSGSSHIQTTENSIPSISQAPGYPGASTMQGVENPVPSKNTAESVQIDQATENSVPLGGGTKPLPVVVEDNLPSSPPPPKQSEPNKKQRTITDVDFYPTEKQKTCTHPRTAIVHLSDNITICHHCYGLLDENLKLIQEEKVPDAEAA
jgi:GntR family transcriptional regulator